MSEPVRDAEERAEVAPAADPGAVDAAARQPLQETLGTMLSHQRERLGLSLNDVASRLRLHPRQLAAMEADRFDTLPRGPFLRGFVRNYARQLRLDPGPLLLQLERQVGSSPDASESAAVGAGSLGALNRDRVSRAVVIGGGLAALALFAVMGWVVSRPVTGPEAGHSTVPAPAVEAEPALRTAPVAPAAGSDAPASASPGGAETSAASAPPPAPSVATAEIKNARATGLAIRFVFGERPSWVEVTQGDGRVIYSGMNDPGSERRIVGQPPLRLVVGNASSVRIEARGRDIDLAPFVRGDDLARLTLE
jgi:cytoskeleton protein RodZ